MKHLNLGLLCAVVVGVCAFAMAAPAFAQVANANGTEVSVPIGQLAGAGFGLVGAIALGVVTRVISVLPGPIKLALTLMGVNENLGKALAWGRRKVEEKYGAKVWTLDTRNVAVAEAVAWAANYAATNFGKRVQGEYGGAAAVEQKLAARMQEWLEEKFPKTFPSAT